jgi:hypothetical protein
MPNFKFEVEYAKSGRAACKQCKDKIAQGALRLGMKDDASAGGEEEDAAARQMAHTALSVKWHHLECFHKVRGKAWCKKNLPEDMAEYAGFGDLREADQERVIAVLKACREGVPPPPAPEGTGSSELPVAEETPKKRGKKADGAEDGSNVKRAKKGSADASAAEAAPKGVLLTEEQEKALETVRASLSKMNAAALGSLLAKNGLPKSGKKEELVERAVEAKALGVPPICTTCNKVKLRFARSTGVFSCPGFFCEEAKRFKKCKGPGPDAELKRTAWQELC